MRLIVSLLMLATILFSLSGCSIPFDVNSDPITIELPTTYGVYLESTLTMPSEALRPNTVFNEVVVYYTIKKSDAFPCRIKAYASPDQTADNLQGSGDEQLFDVSLGASETSKSGSAVSPVIQSVLNLKQSVMVFGVENLTIDPLSTITVHVTLHLRGSYSLF